MVSKLRLAAHKLGVTPEQIAAEVAAVGREPCTDPPSHLTAPPHTEAGLYLLRRGCSQHPSDHVHQDFFFNGLLEKWFSALGSCFGFESGDGLRCYHDNGNPSGAKISSEPIKEEQTAPSREANAQHDKMRLLPHRSRGCL